MTKLYVGKFPSEYYRDEYTDAFLFDEFQKHGIEEVANKIANNDYGDIAIFTFNTFLLHFFTLEWASDNMYRYDTVKEKVVNMETDQAYFYGCTIQQLIENYMVV